jgi:hypothetical protein
MFRTFALVAALLALPSTVLADVLDEVGDAGRIQALHINHVYADTYLQFHGRVFIGKNADEYRWGGTSCGTKVLPDNMVSLLEGALDSGLTVEPLWKPGSGSAKCLVGFNIGS